MFYSAKLVCFESLPLSEVTSVVTNVFRSVQSNEMLRHNCTWVFVKVRCEVCLQPSPEGVITSYLTLVAKGGVLLPSLVELITVYCADVQTGRFVY